MLFSLIYGVKAYIFDIKGREMTIVGIDAVKEKLAYIQWVIKSKHSKLI